nr:efflux RND transporter periplasmic adaptor subunit [Jiella mangrovi]
MLLAGCSGSEEEQAPAAPRPVLTTVLAKSDPQILGYSGTVEPRFETQLAFRVLGRIVSRSVNVGDEVTKGEPVAAVNAETLNADLRSAAAQLESAEIEAKTARASFERTQQLFKDKAVAQSDVDTSRQSLSSAEANLVSAKAELSKAKNSLSYAELTAPFDGVITAREADVGQVVSAGEEVMTLARTDQREAVIDVPVELAGKITLGSKFEVVLQIAASKKVTGTVREMAPQADTATRTIRVRIHLDNPPAAFRLGSLITAIPAERADKPIILLPPGAVLEEDGKTMLWIVDTKAKTVHKQPVVVERDGGGQILLVSGAEPGTVIVIAGVHSLKEGQAVSLSKGLQS